MISRKIHDKFVDPITVPAHHMENKELDGDLKDQEDGIRR